MFEKQPLLGKKEFLSSKYLQEGLSLKGIAKELGCGRTQVARALRFHNIPRREKKNPGLNLLGQKFNRLEVIEKVKRKSRCVHWKCRCNCGKTIEVETGSLTTGDGQSCGCLRHDLQVTGIGEIGGWYLYRLRSGALNRGWEWNVTPEYLWQLFLNQKRRCVFSGLRLKFTPQEKREQTASLDRIDSKKGYIEGNLQWTHKSFNLLKKNLSDEEFIQLCQSVAKQHPPVRTPIIYLAGLISTVYTESLVWRERVALKLEDAGFEVLNPLRGKQLNTSQDGGMTTTCQSSKCIVLRDFDDVKRSDVVLVNLNTWNSPRPLVGTLYEMGLCLYIKKPVIAILDKTSYLRGHPFIKESVNEFFETEEEAVTFIKRYYNPLGI